jgi:hypothetical protein
METAIMWVLTAVVTGLVLYMVVAATWVNLSEEWRN